MHSGVESPEQGTFHNNVASLYIIPFNTLLPSKEINNFTQTIDLIMIVLHCCLLGKKTQISIVSGVLTAAAIVAYGCRIFSPNCSHDDHAQKVSPFTPLPTVTWEYLMAYSI